MASEARILRLKRELDRHVEYVEKLFVPGVKVTIIVRDTNDPRGSLFVGNDEVEDAIRAVRFVQDDPASRPFPGEPALARSEA